MTDKINEMGKLEIQFLILKSKTKSNITYYSFIEIMTCIKTYCT